MRITTATAVLALAGVLSGASAARAQSFTAQPLPVSLSNPTSLQFGPDGRLYVTEQYGALHAYRFQRSAQGTYAVIASESSTLIRDIGNHDDSGAPCSADCARRQVTGLLVAGTATDPLIYVSSSDPRVAVANDSGLDTNSGMLSRLRCTAGLVDGQCAAGGWERVDLVRGLPRSEENHAVNGMALDEVANVLYLAVGGNTNSGAVSASFSGASETFFSAAILAIDLGALAAIEAANAGPYIDQRDGARFVHDLLTLDDPARPNIDLTHPAFPYAEGHPWRERQIDLGDPFGGNNGHNQAIPQPGGPVQVYSPGYRNPYDVLLTRSGTLYTWDNGANAGWGGTPVVYTASGQRKGYINEPGLVYDPDGGDHCRNEINESGSATEGDGLHRIDAAGYYGGHPAPTRAFPAASGLPLYQQQESGHWLAATPVRSLQELLPAGYGLTLADFPDDPRQCRFEVASGALESISASTNGLAEYTAGNFAGALEGDLLAASFNGNVYRCKPSAEGLQDLPGASGGTREGACEVLFSGFGSLPLDLTVQGDAAVFPGTVWVASYGASSITVFEPSDAACDLGNAADDADGDGYSNGDEIASGSSPCSAGSRPDDQDGDFLSDLADPDDDNDGIADVDDAFALDAGNGLNTPLPLHYPLFNNDPGTGLFGLGFTGLMLPGDGTADWKSLHDPAQLAAGGTAGLLTVEAVATGDARAGANTAAYGFQFGVAVDQSSPPFRASTRMLPPWFGAGAAVPQVGQYAGLFLGRGEQDNYLAVVLAARADGSVGVDVVHEVAGVATVSAIAAGDWGGSALLQASAIELSLQVDPAAARVQPMLSLDGGLTRLPLGAAVDIPATWLDAGDAQGLAIGAISSRGAADTFPATWDHFSVAPLSSESLGSWERIAGFDAVRHEGGFVQAGADFHLLGGRESQHVRSYDTASGLWRSGAASPVLLHHFQAVELDGVVYVAGAMTGPCCAEPPVNRVYLYDPLADRWMDGPALPAERLRGGGGAVAVDGRLYLVSGNRNGHYGPLSDAVDVYDPRTGRFTALAPIPHPRDHFSVVHHNGRLYAVGGRNSNAGDGNVFDDTVAEVDVYDIASNQWSTLPALLPTPRAAAATGLLDATLVVAGGEGPSRSTAHPETEGLDLATGQWRTLSPMLTARHAAQALVSGGALYVVAGSSQRGGPDSTPLDLERLQLGSASAPGGVVLQAGTAAVPDTLDFGELSVGAQRSLMVRLQHTGGNQAVVIDTLGVSGDAAFRLASPRVLPFVLPPGGTLDIAVLFAPDAPGSASAQLQLGSPGRAALTTSLSGSAYGGSSASVLHRINVGGPLLPALDAPAPDWQGDTASSPSARRVGGGEGLFDDGDPAAYPGPVLLDHASLPEGLPPALLQSERWDPADDTEMHWRFAVPSGSEVELRLYFAELYSGVTAPAQRVFGIEIDGAVPAGLASIDRFATAGAKGGFMLATRVLVTDGQIDLRLLHGVENPALNGIEVRRLASANVAPVAANDWLSVPAGSTVTLNLFANDADPDGVIDPSSLRIVVSPEQGVVIAVGNGWTYTHDGSRPVDDRFAYSVRDSRGAESNVAEVRIGPAAEVIPPDADGDGVSNAADGDDDNDGLPDTSDPFALDSANGLTTLLPQRRSLQEGDPGSGLLGLGFTGVMSDGVVGQREGQDYAALIDPPRIFLDRGPPARLSLIAVAAGSAEGAANALRQGLQFGLAIEADTAPFVVAAELGLPLFDGAPQPGQLQGIQLGRGDQDNFLRLAVSGAAPGLLLSLEVNGVASAQALPWPAAAPSTALQLLLAVQPATAQVQAMVAIDGSPPVAIGAPISVPPAWLSTAEGRGLALGLMASAGDGAPFNAHYGALSALPLAADDRYPAPGAGVVVLLDVLANDAGIAGRHIAAVGVPDRGGDAALDDGGTPDDSRDDRIRYRADPASTAAVELFTYTVSSGFGWQAEALVAVEGGALPRLLNDGFESPP